jgi:hypothetical protein
MRPRYVGTSYQPCLTRFSRCCSELNCSICRLWRIWTLPSLVMSASVSSNHLVQRHSTAAAIWTTFSPAGYRSQPCRTGLRRRLGNAWRCRASCWTMAQ